MLQFNNAEEPSDVLADFTFGEEGQNSPKEGEDLTPAPDATIVVGEDDTPPIDTTSHEDIIKKTLEEDDTKTPQPNPLKSFSDPNLNPDSTTEVKFEFEELVPEIAKHLYEKGFIKHIPEDVNLDEFDLDAYEKTLTFDRETIGREKFEEGATAMRTDMMNKLSPFAQKLIMYNLDNPNATDDEIKSLTNELAASQYLIALDPEQHAEEIVREYYKSAKWQDKDIDTKVENLVSTDSLKREAEIVKPQLDEKAREIATAREEEGKLIQKYEGDRRTALKDTVISQLQTGKLNGMPIDRETAEFLYAAVLNEEQTVHLGKRKVQMGYAEALMRQQKYEGNIENVMLSLIVLKDGPEGIKKYYAQKAKNDEVIKHVKDVKFSNRKKKSSTSPVKTKKISTGLSFKM